MCAKMQTKIAVMRIKILSVLLVCVFALTACQTTEKPYDLYLLIGQSNMAGRGAVEAIDKAPHPNVFMLTKDGQWRPAVEPIHFDKPKRIGTGPGLAFGKAMASVDTDARIGLIPSAVGGSTISAWQAGGYYKRTKVHPYDDAIARTKVAMQHGELKAILWHQGEYDSNPKKVPLYKDALIKLAADLRRDLDTPDVPFIVGGLGEFIATRRPESVQITAILKAAPNFMDNTAFVSAQGLTDKGDNLHFNTQSYRTLGERYAVAVQEMRGR